MQRVEKCITEAEAEKNEQSFIASMCLQSICYTAIIKYSQT